MVDYRENILTRLVALAAGVPGINLAARNKINPSDQELPAIIVFDADELGDEADPDKAMRPPNAPRRVRLTPEIAIMFEKDTPNIGSSLNAARTAMIKAIMTDATLAAYTQDGRGIYYLGCTTDLARGRSTEGTMSLHFAFNYALRASDL